MSMKPQPIPEIPAETVRVVRAVFPKGNIYIHLRDTFVSTCTISRPGIEDARCWSSVHLSFPASASFGCCEFVIGLDLLID